MSNFLVVIEQSNGNFVQSSLGVACKVRDVAAQSGATVTALVVGSGITDAAPSLGAWGIGNALVVDDAACASPVAGTMVDIIAAAIAQTGASHVFASASVLAAEWAGAVAARLDGGVTTDGVELSVNGGDVVMQRPALDDSVYVNCGWTSPGAFKGVGLFRANTFVPDAANGGSATCTPLAMPAPTGTQVEFRGVEQAETGGVDITDADTLVGAGRGLGGPENFGIVESLAKALGGEVATTRAVVDAGWYDFSTQVGQTGKTVAPKLYLAVGISGAIQHKIGMQSSDVIVAINKDPHAPIFDFADLAVVGDLFQIVPKLEAAIRERKG